MARTLTMRNNCLSLLNWLMKGLREDRWVFFPPNEVKMFMFFFLWPWLEMEKNVKSPNCFTRILWLLIMWCIQRLHHFDSYSTVGLIEGKIRAKVSSLLFLGRHGSAARHLRGLPVALKDEAASSSRLVVRPALSLQEPEAHVLRSLLSFSAT